MTSTFTFSKNSFAERLRAFDPAWRFALAAFIAARAWFLIWPLVISTIMPMAVQNLDLFGTPVVAAFDLASNERYVFSRQVDGAILSFRLGDPGNVADLQTGSEWSLRNGLALSGPYAGRRLGPSSYDSEDLYPYHGVAPDPNPLLGVWQRFDANWYLDIAEGGYSATGGSAVYFPLYPIAIRLVGDLLSGRELLAALLISNLSVIVALVLLYKISSDLVGASGARRALVYLAMFPTSFFFLAPYTESLFLCLSLATLYSALRGRMLGAGLLGALAALTRLQGVVLMLPLIYIWWAERGKLAWSKKETNRTLFPRILHFCSALFDSHFLVLLLIPLATASFLLVTNLSLLASYEGQLHARFVLPWDNLTRFNRFDRAAQREHS